METSFYHDEAVNQHDVVKKLKRAMTLDFNGPSSKKQKGAAPSNLLSSPDLNMLKLASPELERMIISQNGMVTTTPTPTQFLCPSNVTEEQEAYARGFVDALNQLHEKEGPQDGENFVNVSTTSSAAHSMPVSVANVTAPIVSSTSMAMPATTIMTSQPFTTTTSLPGSVMNMSYTTAPQQTASNTGLLPQVPNPRVVQIKQEEPQTVPCINSMPSPPMSPINMENQEKIKLERKRERNRVAARKCRTRKLERISRLEDRVNQLKGQNSQLTDTATDLRDQVCKLKEQIMTHVNSGCHVMLSQNIL